MITRKKMGVYSIGPSHGEYILAQLRRAYRQGEQEEVLLPQPGSLEEWIMKDTTSSAQVWEFLQCILHSMREQRLAYLLFHCGLRPREIVHLCSQEFGDVDEIHRLRRTIMDRLSAYNEKE